MQNAEQPAVNPNAIVTAKPVLILNDPENTGVITDASDEVVDAVDPEEILRTGKKPVLNAAAQPSNPDGRIGSGDEQESDRGDGMHHRSGPDGESDRDLGTE